MRIHNKFIIIPLTDYNTLYMFYKDELMKYFGIDRNIDVSSMAKVSVGIPLGYIKNIIQNILNLNRRITLKFKPLLATEIMDEVLKYEPLPARIVSKFENFENRTPLGRKRLRMLAKEKALLERAKKLRKWKNSWMKNKSTIYIKIFYSSFFGKKDYGNDWNSSNKAWNRLLDALRDKSIVF